MNKTATTETAKEETTEDKAPPQGSRGEVGQPTAALTIKQMWHEAHHVLKDVGDKHNPRKQEWVKKAGAPSLKRYAHELARSGNQSAKDWFANKRGAKRQKRSEENVKRILLERQASKAARRKKGAGKQPKAATTTTEVK